ncbi:MAG: hypothetical protein AABY04_04520 [Candidatus Micrarchaeota archaeon]
MKKEPQNQGILLDSTKKQIVFGVIMVLSIVIIGPFITKMLVGGLIGSGLGFILGAFMGDKLVRIVLPKIK